MTVFAQNVLPSVKYPKLYCLPGTIESSLEGSTARQSNVMKPQRTNGGETASTSRTVYLRPERTRSAHFSQLSRDLWWCLFFMNANYAKNAI